MFSSDKHLQQQKMLAAGFYNAKFATYFMPIKYSLLLLGLAGIYFLSLKTVWLADNLLLFMALWLVISLILPDSYLAIRAKNLSHKISNKLPYLLDLMAVCVQTGMTIEAAISYLAKEMKGFDKDISYLLVKTDDRARLVGLETALDELYARVPSNEMRSFVMTLKQSLQYGSSIYTVLTTLSADIREVQMLQIEEKIGKLAAKMSIPLIVFIMVPIVILIAAPGVMRMMINA
nr:type II secretion system F family protein [Vibrio navarrensis]